MHSRTGSATATHDTPAARPARESIAATLCRRRAAFGLDKRAAAGVSWPVAFAMAPREELKQIVLRKSLLTRPEGYVLASGQWSPYYFDLKLTTLSDPRALRLASEVLLERIDALAVKVDA